MSNNIQQKSLSKTIILLALPCEATNILYHYLQQHFDLMKVVLEPAIPKTKLVRRRARRFGYTKALGQVLFQLSIPPYLRWRSAARRRAIQQTHHLQTKGIPSEKTIHVPSVNSRQTRQLLRQLQPDLVVINGTRIISGKTIRAISAPFINMHIGITPLYRGVHGGYWALANQQPEHCGVSIHLVDKGIDTGGILAQTRITVTKQDNFVTYPLLQCAEGLPLLRSVITKIFQNKLQILPPPDGDSKLWLHPTIWTYLKNYWTYGIT